jgi:hypothetical protein
MDDLEAMQRSLCIEKGVEFVAAAPGWVTTPPGDFTETRLRRQNGLLPERRSSANQQTRDLLFIYALGPFKHPA